MRLAGLIPMAVMAALPGAALADSAYTPLALDACEMLQVHEDGGADWRCDGFGGVDVLVSEGDARMDVDYGLRNDSFESFSAFNSVGGTVEWMLDEDTAPYAAALRFHIDVDGRSAEALVVSRLGSEAAPGCVVGVVDAAAEQANGIARGLGALARYFDCATDQVVIVPGASQLVAGFNGANRF